MASRTTSFPDGKADRHAPAWVRPEGGVSASRPLGFLPRSGVKAAQINSQNPTQGNFQNHTLASQIFFTVSNFQITSANSFARAELLVVAIAEAFGLGGNTTPGFQGQTSTRISIPQFDQLLSQLSSAFRTAGGYGFD
jgi:hypothetical protein